jgi:uncharacterized protein with PIN domain
LLAVGWATPKMRAPRGDRQSFPRPLRQRTRQPFGFGVFDAHGGVELDLWLLKAGVEIVAEQADQARRAWRRFRKGRHPAGLNFGDCFSYSLSALTQEPLLFKGNDFSRTDIEAA